MLSADAAAFDAASDWRSRSSLDRFLRSSCVGIWILGRSLGRLSVKSLGSSLVEAILSGSGSWFCVPE